jgi:magnesium transporter
MLRSLYLTADRQTHTDLPVDEYLRAMNDPKGILWVDFQGTSPEDDAPILLETFGFHPLAVDDALQESHVPKLDDWGEYLYIVLHSVLFDLNKSGDLSTQELDVFLGKNYVVTHHDEPIDALDRVWSTCQRDERYIKNGADHLLYRLIDELVASIMPVVEQMDEAVDESEDRIFNRPTPEMLERIFSLKRAILRMRRIIGPQREVLNKLARDEYKVIDSKARVYFRDVYDHLVRLYDIAESVRDLIGGTLDTYLSVVNNRMNDIMKTLTIITTLFMPITFVTGFFGMNYFQPVTDLTAWTDRPAFFVILAILVLLPMAMYFWIRRRGWM